MPTFLILQTTYDAIQIGLFSDTQLLGSTIEDKHNTSSQLLISIDALLAAHGQTVASLDAIAATCGPAPFTSLRTVLTCVNGISYVTKTPLIALDGIQMLLAEYQQADVSSALVVCNAFNKELYYGFYNETNQLITGYGRYSDLATKINQMHTRAIDRFIGNGVALCADQLAETFGLSLVELQDAPEINTLSFLGHFIAVRYAHNTLQYVDQLFPLYLKSIP